MAPVRGTFERRLYGAMAVAALVIVFAGFSRSFARVHADPDEAAFAAVVAGYNFVSLTLFASLLGIALHLRHRSDVHKRLMLLASLSLLGPPLARLVTNQQAIWLTYVCVLVPVAIDTRRHRRLHPAFGWGAALIVISSQVALHLAAMPRWIDFCVRTFV